MCRLSDMSVCPTASLATTKFQVGHLATRLRASTQALEEAQAQLAEFKANNNRKL
jgi:hypothetical protein